jgi:hypothetical protein
VNVVDACLVTRDAPLQALVANDGVELCAREGEPVDAQLPPDAVRLVAD